MKKTVITLLIFLTLNSYGQEYTFTSEPMTCVKLDSLIWKKINSWTHRTVIGWLDRSISTVTSIFHISSNGAMHMDVTYHAK